MVNLFTGPKDQPWNLHHTPVLKHIHTCNSASTFISRQVIKHHLMILHNVKLIYRFRYFKLSSTLQKSFCTLYTLQRREQLYISSTQESITLMPAAASAAFHRTKVEAEPRFLTNQQRKDEAHCQSSSAAQCAALLCFHFLNSSGHPDWVATCQLGYYNSYFLHTAHTTHLIHIFFHTDTLPSPGNACMDWAMLYAK